MTLSEDQLKESKKTTIYLEGVLKLLQRIYYEGLILIFLLMAFGCLFEYLMIRLINK